MVARATYLAAILYVAPLLIFVAVRSRRDRNAWELGLDVPLFVALDLLGVMLLARVMVLETAILVSRPLWAVWGAASVVWRARRQRPLPAWPSAIGLREIGLVVVVATLAFYLSMELSRACLNADRRWHIPLVAS